MGAVSTTLVVYALRPVVPHAFLVCRLLILALSAGFFWIHASPVHRVCVATWTWWLLFQFHALRMKFRPLLIFQMLASAYVGAMRDDFNATQTTPNSHRTLLKASRANALVVLLGACYAWPTETGAPLLPILTHALIFLGVFYGIVFLETGENKTPDPRWLFCATAWLLSMPLLEGAVGFAAELVYVGYYVALRVQYQSSRPVIVSVAAPVPPSVTPPVPVPQRRLMPVRPPFHHHRGHTSAFQKSKPPPSDTQKPKPSRESSNPVSTPNNDEEDFNDLQDSLT